MCSWNLLNPNQLWSSQVRTRGAEDGGRQSKAERRPHGGTRKHCQENNVRSAAALMKWRSEPWDNDWLGKAWAAWRIVERRKIHRPACQHAFTCINPTWKPYRTVWSDSQPASQLSYPSANVACSCPGVAMTAEFSRHTLLASVKVRP